MPLRKVYSGAYECPECEQQYDAEAASDDELVCVDCDGVRLVEIDEEEDVEAAE